MMFFTPRKKASRLPSGCEIPVPGDFAWDAHFDCLAGQACNEMLRKYYQCPVIPGHTPLSRVSFLALDLETTGLDREKDKIISIGFIPFDIRRIYLAGGRNFLINPVEPMTEASVTIHRIKHSDLDQKPRFEDVLPSLLQAMEHRIPVVHYHPIERQFLAARVQSCFNEIFEFPMIDTMILENRFHTLPKKFWGINFFKRPRLSLRLDASRSRYGLPRYVPHHALTDAIATAELLQAQIQTFYSPDTHLRSLWI